jgi:hypothetical protein
MAAEGDRAVVQAVLLSALAIARVRCRFWSRTSGLLGFAFGDIGTACAVGRGGVVVVDEVRPYLLGRDRGVELRGIRDRHIRDHPPSEEDPLGRHPRRGRSTDNEEDRLTADRSVVTAPGVVGVLVFVAFDRGEPHDRRRALLRESVRRAVVAR